MNLTQRTSADISIKRPPSTLNGSPTTLVTVPITAASRRTFKLMEEDSITLVWCGSDLFRFLPGDFIVDELFGRFVVATEQTGQWNKTSGGYDYQLKLVSEYWMWNNYLLMYTQEIVSSGGGGGGFIGDEIVPRRHAPGTISTNTKRYEARYHLTGQLQDHVGVVLENVKILNLIANVTYSKNITAERRDEVHYICYDGMHICDALTAIANEYETEWWVTRVANTITIHLGKCESQGNAVVLNTGEPDYEIETYSVSRNQNTYANRIYALGSEKNIPRSYGKAQSDKNYITCKITTFETVSQQGTTPPDPETDPRYSDGHLKPIDDNGEEIDISIPTVEYYRFKDTNHVIAQNMCHMGRVEVTINSASQALFVDGEGYLFYTTCPGAWNVQSGTEFRVNIYDPSNANKPYGLYENKIPESWFADSSDDPSSVYSFGERRLMLPSTYPDEWEDGYIIGGYRRWVQKSNLPQQNVVEQVVIFDNIYPKCYLKVTSVKEEAASQKEVFDDGSFIMWNWTRYTLEAVQYPSGDPFKFDAGFTDGKLEATFLSDMDEQEAYEERKPSGSGSWTPGANQRLLAGMKFGVGFRIETINNVKHYYYELVRNEDYGTLLPNDVLKPTIGDVFVLTGWDVKAMKITGLIESAENALAMAALEYLQAIEEGQFTFQLGMMTQWALGGSQSDYTLPDPGQKYSLPLPIGNGRKVSRLIGYELKLDMPYDSPQLTIGETEAYSRLKRMERRMSGSVSAGYSSKPSSHMPRTIYFRVYTFLSHISAVGDVPSHIRIVMPLEIELAADTGYAISNVVVRMDGEAVDGAWDSETNTVFIDAVVGDIEIVADAEETLVTTYSVTANLTNITSDAPQSVAEGDPLTVNLTADTGHYIDDSSVVVMMGNTDITSTAYSNGVVTIAEVTGDVSITAGTMFDAQVEYLQSDGTAYIDTGVKGASDITIEADIEVLSTFTGESCAVFGSRIAGNNSALVLQYYKTSSGTTKYWRWAFGNNAQTANHNGTTGDFHLSSVNAARTMVITGAHDSTITCSNATFSNNYNIYLFAMNNGGAIGGVGGIAYVPIKSFKIYDGGTLVRDYIPVRKDGVGYLYDQVTETLYGNANESGAFSYGSDVLSEE